MKKKFSLIELRQFIQIAVDEIATEENISIDLALFTCRKYYTSGMFNYFRKEAKMIKGEQILLLPFLTRGIYCHDQIIVFCEPFYQNAFLRSEYSLVEIMITVFHEIAHILQEKNLYPYTSYELVIDYLEVFIQNFDYQHYSTYWNYYYKERISNLYGIKKACEFFNHYPEFYESKKDYIDRKKEEYKLLVKIYDFNFIFNKFHSINQEKFSIDSSWKVNELFYQDDSVMFKDILALKEIFEIDDNHQQLLYSILATNAYIEQVNFDNLSDEEVAVMIMAIHYIYDEELEKKMEIEKYLVKYPKMKRQYLKYLFHINQRIHYLDDVLQILVLKKDKYSLEKKMK